MNLSKLTATTLAAILLGAAGMAHAGPINLSPFPLAPSSTAAAKTDGYAAAARRSQAGRIFTKVRDGERVLAERAPAQALVRSAMGCCQSDANSSPLAGGVAEEQRTSGSEDLPPSQGS